MICRICKEEAATVEGLCMACNDFRTALMLALIDLDLIDKFFKPPASEPNNDKKG